MTRAATGKKYTLIDTQLEVPLLVAEQKKLLSFDFEIRCVGWLGGWVRALL